MRNPKVSLKIERSADNSISIINEEEYEICNITTEDSISEEQFKFARMIQMSPIMLDLFTAYQDEPETGVGDFIKSISKIRKYIDKGGKLPILL